MRSLSWFMISIAVGSLCYHLIARIRLRSQDRPLPAWAAGDIAGDFALLCLALSMLLTEHDTLSIAFSVSTLLFLSVAITQSFVARRRAAEESRSSTRAYDP